MACAGVTSAGRGAAVPARNGPLYVNESADLAEDHQACAGAQGGRGPASKHLEEACNMMGIDLGPSYNRGGQGGGHAIHGYSSCNSKSISVDTG